MQARFTRREAGRTKRADAREIRRAFRVAESLHSPVSLSEVDCRSGSSRRRKRTNEDSLRVSVFLFWFFDRARVPERWMLRRTRECFDDERLGTREGRVCFCWHLRHAAHSGFAIALFHPDIRGSEWGQWERRQQRRGNRGLSNFDLQHRVSLCASGSSGAGATTDLLEL
jgi:hypothetical protein